MPYVTVNTDVEVDLDMFDNDELIEELARRRNEREINKPERWCDDCKHFKTWGKQGDPPDHYNPCAKGHKMIFAVPENCYDEFGFYRRVCADRQEIQDAT